MEAGDGDDDWSTPIWDTPGPPFGAWSSYFFTPSITSPKT